MSKITYNVRHEMFAWWCKYKPKYGWKKSMQEIAKRCGVCERTVEKYKDVDKWDKRLEDIQLQACSLADNDRVKETAKSLRILNKAEDYLEGKLDSEDKTLNGRLGDVSSIAKTKQLLMGEATDRSEITGGIVLYFEDEDDDADSSDEAKNGR